MKKRSLLRLLSSSGVALGGLVLASSEAHAAGTALDVQSGRGIGMAAAMTAHVDDASALYYNPAGIAQGKKVDLQAGITPIIPGFKYTDTSGSYTRLNAKVVTPFSVYATAGITDDLSVGIGAFVPYGLTLTWPDGWVGRRTITKVSQINVDINPTVAYRIGPVRIGAGMQIVRSAVELRKQIAFPDQEGSTKIAAGDWGFGGNIGAQVEAIPKYLNLGVHYRSRVKFDYDDGHAEFNNIPAAYQSLFRNQGGKTSITTPDTIAFGVSTHPIDNLLLAFDATYNVWSVFDKLDISFNESPDLNIHQAKNFGNRFNFHLGGEYTINENFKVRAGIMYDPSPSPASTLSPDVPDADRINLALGAQYQHRCGFYGDLGYQYLFMLSKTSTYAPLPGEYGGNVNIIGLSLGYRFDLGAKNTPPPPPPTDGGTPDRPLEPAATPSTPVAPPADPANPASP